MHIIAISMYMIDLKDTIIEAANSNQHYLKIKETLQQGNLQHKFKYYELKEDGILMYKGKVYVPNSSEMKNTVVREMHNVPYVEHPRYQKSIAAIRSQYFWHGVKKEVANYIAKCLEFQKVKNEHRHPARLLHPFPIQEWKWEVVTIDFITNMPRMIKNHDSIMVVVDKLTKDAHFIPIKTTNKEKNIAEIYMKEVDKLHRVPKEIVSDRDPKFTSDFGKVCSKALAQI
jgi:hypothetical protein